MDLDIVENPIAYEQIMSQQQAETKGLADLIDDCKGLIFEQLELIDLLNIADTNTQMQPMVRQVFERKYSNRRVVIDIENKNR